MWSWFTFFLIGHILSVLVAFGPVFAFPLIAAQAQKDPVHGRFGAEIIDLIERRITLRVAGVVALFGIGLIFTAHVDFFSSPWILIAVVLYIAAYAFAGFVQAKNSARMVELLKAMPPGPPPAGTPRWSPIRERSSRATIRPPSRRAGASNRARNGARARADRSPRGRSRCRRP